MTEDDAEEFRKFIEYITSESIVTTENAEASLDILALVDDTLNGGNQDTWDAIISARGDIVQIWSLLVSSVMLNTMALSMVAAGQGLDTHELVDIMRKQAIITREERDD